MKSILVVDDDKDILEAVHAALSMEGYLVSVTQRGDLVLEIIGNALPDLILMDIMMAGIDGRDICRQLKGLPNYAHIPVILFSASALTVSEVMTCGANDFLSKPFDIDNLIKKISHLAA